MQCHTPGRDSLLPAHHPVDVHEVEAAARGGETSYYSPGQKGPLSARHPVDAFDVGAQPSGCEAPPWVQTEQSIPSVVNGTPSGDAVSWTPCRPGAAAAGSSSNQPVAEIGQQGSAATGGSHAGVSDEPLSDPQRICGVEGYKCKSCLGRALLKAGDPCPFGNGPKTQRVQRHFLGARCLEQALGVHPGPLPNTGEEEGCDNVESQALPSHGNPLRCRSASAESLSWKRMQEGKDHNPRPAKRCKHCFQPIEGATCKRKECALLQDPLTKLHRKGGEYGQ